MRSLFRFDAWPDTTNRRIMRAALTIGLLTLLVKAVTALKEVLVAGWFGRSDSLDAFLIAYLVPSVVMSVTVGALVMAFVPAFVEAREQQGADAAQRLFSSIIALGGSGLVVIALLMALLAPYYLPYFGSGFSPHKLRLARELLYLQLPFVFFGGMAVFLTTVLNAGEKFALAALAPLLTPVVTIGLLQTAAQNWGVFALAAGTVAGSLLEAAMVAYGLKGQGLRLAVRWGGVDSSMRQVFRQFAPNLAATFLMCSTNVVDQSMAAMLQGGSVAALSYAARIVAAVVALGALPLGRAALPYFSKMVAQNDWSGCRHTLKRYTALVAITTIPLTAGLMVFSRPLVRVIFQRGAFTAADSDLVSRVQVFYLIQIPFYIAGLLFVQFLSSIRRNDVLMYGAALNLVLDVVLNLALMRIWGIAGIALSTSIVYIVSFVFLSTCSIRALARQRRSTPLIAQPEQAILVNGVLTGDRSSASDGTAGAGLPLERG